MATTNEQLPIRPYARLLTMLGEQLIKNDRIALVELIKNSYDADATDVEVRFEGFGPDLAVTPEARIILVDNGHGMTTDVVREHWLNPATSLKREQKRAGRQRTPGGRVVQGEKGIGRFAMFKLGSVVEMTTRAIEQPVEVAVKLDISFLDDESVTSRRESTDDGASEAEDQDTDRASRQQDAMFLDELFAAVETREPHTFDGSTRAGGESAHGTRIEIGDLRGGWSESELARLHQDVTRLRPLSGLLTGDAGTDPLSFDVRLTVDGSAPEFLVGSEVLIESLGDRAVLRVIGTYDAIADVYRLTVNDEDRTVALNSHDFRGLRLFTRHFGSTTEDVHLHCGDFSFEFLFFDLRPSAPTRHLLDQDEKSLVREHRIYLYRDGVRVLPYGDPDDDWLQLDVIRGTQGASRVFSNDQTLGFIYISQELNPDLRDKTNREGLLDSGRAYSEFILAIQLLVTYLRRGDFARYLLESGRRDEAQKRREAAGISEVLKTLAAEVSETPRLREVVADLTRRYKVEHDFMAQRVRTTEDLAGVGLSVETASHDVVATAGRALRDMRLLHEEIGAELGRASALYARAGTVVTALSFIVSRLEDVQGLFVSSRQRPRDLNVAQFARKVESIYRRVLSDRGITLRYAGDETLTVRTVDAMLLQVFLNLMDNSVYWLSAARVPDPTIEITLDGVRRAVTFSDNGPGIAKENAPYIFDPFFSAKGDEGRGLGLYIAREVARRNGFELMLLPEEDSDLGGASLRLVFEGLST